MRWSYFKLVDMREKSGSSLQTHLKIGFDLHFDSERFYSTIKPLLKKLVRLFLLLPLSSFFGTLCSPHDSDKTNHLFF